MSDLNAFFLLLNIPRLCFPTFFKIKFAASRMASSPSIYLRYLLVYKPNGGIEMILLPQAPRHAPPGPVRVQRVFQGQLTGTGHYLLRGQINKPGSCVATSRATSTRSCHLAFTRPQSLSIRRARDIHSLRPSTTIAPLHVRLNYLVLLQRLRRLISPTHHCSSHDGLRHDG